MKQVIQHLLSFTPTRIVLALAFFVRIHPSNFANILLSISLTMSMIAVTLKF